MGNHDPMGAIPTGNRFKRGTLILGMLVLTPIIVLVGCGGGQDESPTATPEPAPTETSTSSQASTSSQNPDPTSTPATTEEPAATSGATQAEPGSITVTDVAGREVTVEAPVDRMILGEGRQIYIVAMLEPDDPFNRVIGWRDDLNKADLDSYEKYEAKFPEINDIPLFGDPGSGEFSVEKAISLEPDVVILNLGAYQGAQESGLIEELDSAGIPTVVIDFRQHPLENTVPSTLLMGKLMGKQEKAQEFVDYYQQQLDTVYSRIEGVEGPKPEVFLYRAAGFDDCCATFGEANLGLLVERAGGINIGSDLVPGWSGTVNPEEVIASDPDMIIITGANWVNYDLSAGSYVGLGYSATAEKSREQLQGILEARGWDILQSAENGRVHAIWHQFYNSPYHFVALQQFAKWLYPQQFEDLDPTAVYREFHERFLPIEYSGTFWVSLDGQSGASGHTDDHDAASRRQPGPTFSQARLVRG